MSHLLAAARHKFKSKGTWAAISGHHPPPQQLSPDGTWATNDLNQQCPATSYDTNRIHTAHPPTYPRTQETEALLDESTNDPRTRDETTAAPRDNGEDSIQYDDSVKHFARDWRPYTLRPAFLASMAVISLALALTLAVICWYSAKHNGLRKDTDTAALLVARRYLPTILAVFFTQMIVIISNDIKRTEPFARLVRSDRPDVEHTLLYTSKPWWSMLHEGFARKRNAGRVGWTLVLSSLVTGICILTVSTLSSSLLTSESVVLQSVVDLQRFNPTPLALEPRRQVYFHTSSGFLFNASTSMWVSDDYIVSPFGTTDFRDYPDFLPEGKWDMETKVLQMDSTCQRMVFSGFESNNLSSVTEVYSPPGAKLAYNSASPGVYKMGFQKQTSTRSWQGFALDSEDGCHIQITASINARGDHRIVVNGGLLWTNLSSTYTTYDQWAEGRGTPVWSRATEWSPMDGGLLYDFSDKCIGRNLLVITTPWRNGTSPFMATEGFQVRAEICTPRYFEAMTNVTATVTPDARSITLDEDYIRNHRQEVSSDVLNIDKIQQLTFGREKLSYLTLAKTLLGNYAYEGVSEYLSAMYSFDTAVMLESETLPDEAVRLSKRFFGELLLSAMTEQRPEVLASFQGRDTYIQQRIVVVTETAATLSALLFLFSCYLFYLCLTESGRRRPLNLSSDPATTFGCSAYLQQNPSAYVLLETAKIHRTAPRQANKIDISETSQYEGHQLDKGPQVGIKGYTPLNNMGKSATQTWKPTSVRSWPMCALLVTFVLIAVAIIVLQSFASRHLLYRSAFVYQVDLRAFNARFSPQSVLATLLAVGVSMWWDAIDKTLRTAQPFLSMSNSVVDVQHGAALSYQASYWFWASIRAALNSHWLLSLLTFGTTLCQVLIVSMAAIFERGPGIATSIAHVNSSFTIRQSPFTYNHTLNVQQTRGSNYNGQAPFLQDAMRITTSDWMYSALDQITLDAQQPDWSRDGWSFSPVDLASLPSIRHATDVNATDSHGYGSPLSVSSVNSTLTTLALRGRLQCAKVVTGESSWFEENEVDLFPSENSTEANGVRDRLRRAGYILPHTIFNNTAHETSIFSRTSTIHCCSNETDPDGRAAVGYWSQTNTSAWWGFEAALGLSAWTGYGGDVWPPNFAVKWIAGATTTTNVSAYTNGAASEYKIMQFKEVPPMAFLSCKPVIEKANARVILAHGSGQVLDFEILDAPQEQFDPWTAHFRHANESDPKDTIATVSYGSYFLTQLLGASSIAPRVVQVGFYPPFDFENLDDDRFNIRDKEKGYNMDFMSYANLYQANMDPMVLLDPEVLLNHSQRTFQTFFQHFASQTKWLDGQMMAYERTSGNDNEQVEVTITQRIETLGMVPSATWLSLAIIATLIIILSIVIASFKFIYPHDILRNNIACLADMLTLIEGSEGLLWFAGRHDIKTLGQSGLHTKLGWFRDRNGTVRWGIELIDAPGIKWIEPPTAFEMNRVLH